MHRNCIQAIHFITRRCIEDPACSTGQCQHRFSSCFHIEQMQVTKHSSTLFRKVGSTVQLSFRIMYKNSCFLTHSNRNTGSQMCLSHQHNNTNHTFVNDCWNEYIHQIGAKLPITNDFQNALPLYRKSTAFKEFAKLSYGYYSQFI